MENTAKEAEQFYDELAGDYHLIFSDWKKSIEWQGKLLTDIIKQYLPSPGLTVLDCSCGIGTQTIGLALQGYRVHATDISPTSVARTALEAANSGVKITTGVADFRELDKQVEGEFEVVITCDNSLPHLLTQEDMQNSFRNIFEKLKPDGLFIMSIRDYDEILLNKPVSTTPNVFDSPEGRLIVFQLWDWHDLNNIYTLSHFILKGKHSQDWETKCRKVEYRAWRRAELSDLLEKVGFVNMAWKFQNETGFYQPIFTARKPPVV